ncbi:MAG: hypothetical protein KatS3mg026_0619 [Bacteroidia bacterium]|nr:MAG: hypothetical protein KatS3mg026_0619 [Bacteroidia bacterium]
MYVRLGLFGAIGGLWGQTWTLRGQVVDAEGHPVPYAVVRLVEGGFQTAASADGRFVLSLLSDTVVVEVRRLGYRTRRDTVVRKGEGMTQLFVLTAQEVRLPGVVITEGGQDPGELLIRKAIAAKAANRACLPAFQAETYTLYTIRWAEPPPAPLRKALSVPTEKGEVLFMSEAVSRVYFLPPDKYREDIVRSRVVGSRSYSVLGSWPFRDFDPYGERVALPELTETPFVLPLAKDAFLYYRYRLVGQVWDESGFFYKIAVEPRSAVSPCVRGYVLLADESYALVGLEWEADGARPLRYTDTLRVQATWIPVGSCYQLGGLNFWGRFRFSLPAVGQVSVQAEGYAAYQKYRFLTTETPTKKNQTPSARVPSFGELRVSRSGPSPSPVETLRVERIDFGEYVQVLPGADTATEAFWDSVRAAPLDTQQVAYLLRAQEELKKPDTASVSQRRFRFFPDEEGLRWVFSGRRASADRWGIEAVWQWPSYTRQEGWALPVTGRFRRRKGPFQWGASVTLRYGLAWKRVLPALSLGWSSMTFPGWGVEVRGGLSPREPTDRLQVPLLWNALYRLAGAAPPWQGYIRPFVEVEGRRYLHRTLQARLRLSWDRRATEPQDQGVYSAWRSALALEWQPGTRLFRTPRGFFLDAPSRVWAFRLRGACEAAWIEGRPLVTASLEALPLLSISPLGFLQAHIGLAWQDRTAPWPDALYPAALPLLLHRSPLTLMRYPAYASAGPYLGQAVLRWSPQGALLRAVPLLRKLPLQEQVVLRGLFPGQGQRHAELSVYLIFSGKRLAFFQGLSGGLHWSLLEGFRAPTFSVGTALSGESLLFKPALL